MILFPNAKINLGLNIIRKRSDGFHDLETFFCPVDLCDVLEIIPQGKTINSGKQVVFTSSGISINGNPEENICLKAWHLLKQDFPDLPTITMHLHKVIPTGAGLGGGSADGAFTLGLLNSLFNLHIQETQLANYALKLGSDCPFFIFNKPCFAQGQGEKLEGVDIDLSEYEILLVHPGIHISTKDAFANIRPKVPQKSVYGIIQQPINTWRSELENDFEKAIFPQYPVIADIKNQLYELGAIYASMSGSGSAVYGIFKKGNLPDYSFPSLYKQFRIKPGHL